MDLRAHIALWSALAFMACAAPIAWLWALKPGWSRGDVLSLLQTVFSVAALAAALAIAVMEHRRAMRAERQRRDAFIALGNDILRQAAEALRPWITADHDTIVFAYSDVRMLFDALSDAVNAIRASVPPDADLAIWLVSVAREVDVAIFNGGVSKARWNAEAAERIGRFQRLMRDSESL